MKKALKKVLTVLDRTPGEVRGQSLIEMTLTLPILITMLLGLVEVGWLANNYLTLVDVSREAGRYGSVREPLSWSAGEELNYERMDCDSTDGTYNKLGTDLLTTYPGPDLGAPFFDGGDRPIDFYDGVACAVITNMQPLEFDDEVDDIIVSVFSYVVTESPPGVSITGRFPARSNECAGERDPFLPPWMNFDDRDAARHDSGSDGRRGYLFRGNHEVEPGCLGSEFTLVDMEDLLNETMLDGSGGTISGLELDALPNNAFVMVEIYWDHSQLLDLPVFTWMGNPMNLHVWTIFPVTSAESTATPEP